MSLEQAIADLTAVLTKNNSLLEEAAKERAELLGKATKAPTKTAAAKKPAPKDDDDGDDDDEADEAPAKKAPAKKAPAKRAAAKKAPSKDDLVEAFCKEVGDFIGDDDVDADEITARKKLFRSILNKLDAPKASEMDVEDHDWVRDLMKQAVKKGAENVTLDDPEDDEDDMV